MMINGKGIILGGGGLSGKPFATGTAKSSGEGYRYINVNHNLDSSSVIVLFELANVSGVSANKVVSGVVSTECWTQGTTSGGATIGKTRNGCEARVNSSGNLVYSLISPPTVFTNNTVHIDTSINMGVELTYNWVAIAL